MAEALDIRKLITESSVPIVASNLTVAMYLRELLKVLETRGSKETRKDKDIKRDVLRTFNEMLPDVESYIPIEWRLDRLVGGTED
jgi:hypothetical protein